LLVQLGETPLVEVVSLHFESALEQMVRKCLPHQSDAHDPDGFRHEFAPSLRLRDL